MKLIDNDTLRARLDFGRLMDGIADALRSDGIKAPERQVQEIALENGETASLLIMPVWKAGEGVSVKLVTFFPSNKGTDRPTIHAVAVRFDGSHGEAQAVMDADIITSRRTAAASALAAKYLVREDAKRFLLIGTGQLAGDMVRAHHLVRDYDDIAIWGRSIAKAASIANTLNKEGIKARVAEDLETEIRAADVISTVTAATSPIIRGSWLKKGAHLDLVGSFRGDMRESDDECIKRARLFCDSENAMKAGDLAQPLVAGLIKSEDISATLAGLVKGAKGRESEDEITLYKSAGFALLDYVAVELAIGS